MLSPFPAFSLIFAAFTHAQQGGKSAANLVRGVIVGSGGITCSSCWWAHCSSLGITLSYLLASLAAIAAGALTFLVRAAWRICAHAPESQTGRCRSRW